MKSILSILLIHFFCTSNAQSIINTSGTSKSVGGNDYAYNIGELIVTTFSNSTTSITQGLLQPLLKTSTLIHTNGNILRISTYPNPTQRYIHFSSDVVLNSSVKITICTLKGELVFEDKFIPNNQLLNESIDLDRIATGVYTLKITWEEQNQMVSSIQRIIKSN